MVQLELLSENNEKYLLQIHRNDTPTNFVEDEANPNELKGKVYFRILGFVIDNRYRKKGIGSEALKKAI